MCQYGHLVSAQLLEFPCTVFKLHTLVTYGTMMPWITFEVLVYISHSYYE